jgi:hypothetical protein
LAYAWNRQVASNVLSIRRKADPKNLIHPKISAGFPDSGE